MDDASWAALTLTLTLLAGLYTWFAFRRRGIAAGLTGAGITLLPLAAYLTKTLRMFTEIVDAVVDWTARLVFSPTVWLGIVLAGVGVVLIGTGRWLGRRTGDRPRGDRETPAAPVPGRGRGELPGASAVPAGDDDDDLADIEAILRRRGIT